MKVAVVHWGDACATDALAYMDEEECQEIAPIESVDVGILVRDDKVGVVLAGHTSESGYRRVMFIPRKCIHSMKVYGGTRG